MYEDAQNVVNLDIDARLLNKLNLHSFFFLHNLSCVLCTCSTYLGLVIFEPGRNWDRIPPVITKQQPKKPALPANRRTYTCFFKPGVMFWLLDGWYVF